MIYIAKERYNRILALLKHRQPSLAVLAENLQDPHNLSALARTCDAVGVYQLWTLAYNNQGADIVNGIAKGAGKWLEIEPFNHLNQVQEQTQKRKMQLICTTFSERAIDYREVDYTKPSLIVMGQEGWGASEEAQEKADLHVHIPMYGMTQSLNVSVAAALILYEAQRQRKEQGFYDSTQLSNEEYQRLLLKYAAPPKAYSRLKAASDSYAKIEDMIHIEESVQANSNHIDGRDEQRVKGRKRNSFDPNS